MIGRLLGHYRIERRLGAGGMSEVYQAADGKLERRVALKLLSPERASDSVYLERFRREARAVAALHHPNIVTLYSIEEAEGRPFLTMELVEGESLDRRVPRDGFPLAEILAWAVPLCGALEAAHAAGIVHRDLKPANVMLSGSGEVKVLDFGLAKRLARFTRDREETLTQHGTMIGTVAYMAPEQIGGGEVDPRTDLFACGVLLYEMATGRHPFAAPAPGGMVVNIIQHRPAPPSQLKPELGAGFDRVVGRCLEKAPDDRYQAAEERSRPRHLAQPGVARPGRRRRGGGLEQGAGGPLPGAA